MQHHIIQLISVNLSKVLDLNILPTCLSLMILSALMDAQARLNMFFQAYSGGYVSFSFLQEMMLSARLRA